MGAESILRYSSSYERVGYPFKDLPFCILQFARFENELCFFYGTPIRILEWWFVALLAFTMRDMEIKMIHQPCATA
jgi:hypothetical protein